MENLPQATISHRSIGRIRIRIPAKRNDNRFFVAVAEKLKQEDVGAFEANPVTGSLLIMDDDFGPDEIHRFGDTHRLFDLSSSELSVAPLHTKVTDAIGRASGFLNKTTQGEVDIPTIIFLGLLLFGIYEILRGNFRTPPWYTAFWYAFGVFSKSLSQRTQ